MYAPNGVDPLPNVIVYIPNSAVEPFPPGVSCDRCGTTPSGDPLASVTTGADGKFTLLNVPAGSNIPLVVQIGRWRKQSTVTIGACQDTAVPQANTTLPTEQAEGDIPKMAFATGPVDVLECVFRKIGIKDKEFTRSDQGGRIHIYTGQSQPGADAGTGTATQASLMGMQAQVDQYDVLLFPCQGDSTPSEASVTQRARLKAYLDKGGRLFATHYAYAWLHPPDTFDDAADWRIGTSSLPDQIGFVNMTFPKGAALAQWLQLVGASTTLSQIPIETLRININAVTPPTQMWVSVANGTPMHITFNTPLGVPAAQQCGRVVYSDFHVENHSNAEGLDFPTECVDGPMTPQEKLLEYMLFDLAACVTADEP
ncbi:MAG: hypothetical protein IT374_24550 [Polyangiaceae bacterium]|nr:hypothetical protein [Polyangiaceae bacterium]